METMELRELDSSFPFNEARDFGDLLSTISQLDGYTLTGKPIASFKPKIERIQALLALPIRREDIEAVRRLLEEIPVENGFWTATMECCGAIMKAHIVG